MDALDLRIAIADFYDKGNLAGECKIPDLPHALAYNPRSVGMSLQRLGFTQVAKARPGQKRKDGTRTIYPARWKPPADWPAEFKVQRRLRQTYNLTPGQTLRATSSAFGLADILTDAIDVLVTARVSLGSRGKLKAEIKRVVVDTMQELRYDSIARRELAEWLGESPDANRQMLENRVRGLIRFLNKKKE